MMIHRPALLTLLSILVGCDDAVPAPTLNQAQIQQELAQGPSRFIRFIEGKNGSGKLQTSIVRYKDPMGRQVDLISAVHIADRSYYSDLNKRFEKHDSLLYEMIKPKNLKPSRIAKRSTSGVSAIQQMMKRSLDLAFQLEGVDYTASNFVHADLDARTFSKMSKQRGENILGVMLGGLGKKPKKGKNKDKDAGDKPTSKKAKAMNPGMILAALMSKNSTHALKNLLARQLQHAEAMLAGLEEGKDGKGSVLLTERKQAMHGGPPRTPAQRRQAHRHLLWRCPHARPGGTHP